MDKSLNHRKPAFAVTMGDPAGIGPEIAAKVFAMQELYNECRPLLVGNPYIMKMALAVSGAGLEIHPVTAPDQALYERGIMDVFDIPVENPEIIPLGRVSAGAGDVAFRAIREAISLAMDGHVDGVVTCPVNKEALNAAGHHFSGHTEIFAHFTGTKKYAMLLAYENIRVIHVSTHVSLRKACDLVKKERITDVIALIDDGLRKMGIVNPRIGVAGLNPHSGDNGLFGSEETDEIIPAIMAAKQSGINAEGPVPPDTLFALAKGGHFDGCVAMYHDQGHIPFKLAGFDWDETSQTMKSVKGVNITLGLPIIRTSVDHGTAFEIAGKGIACPDALLNAVQFAVKMYRNK